MDIYAENILDHYRHPRHKEPVTNATVTHEERNLSCGDVLSVSLSINDGKITGFGWSGGGCAISQAAMSMLSEELIGKTVDETDALTQKNIYDLLGVPVGPRRYKCALLCLHTLKNTINLHRGKEVQGWLKTVALDE